MTKPYWGLKWNYSRLFHGHVDKENVVEEVVDVLQMWSHIETSYSELPDEEKQKVEVEVGARGQHVEFPGFDANNEIEQYSIARFLIYHLDRFQQFKQHALNSHFPSIESYRRMWHIFEPIRRTLIGRHLSCSEIIDLLK